MHRNFATTAITLMAFAPAISAQEPPDSVVADSVRLGGITVSVARAGLTSGGASSVVVDIDSLSAPPASSMEDVLRSLPLIQIRTNSRGEAQPALRGSEERQVAILMDGVPLTLGWDHRTDMSIIPLTAARSVTLVRGLSSVLYGPNTLGGVVQVDVARAGARIESVDPLSFGLSLDETGGRNVSASGGHIANGVDGQWVFRAGAGHQERDGFPVASGAATDAGVRTQFLAADALRLNSDVRRFDGFFSSQYRARGGAWGSLSASAYDVERGVPPEAHQDGPRLWRYPEQRRLIAALTGGTGQRTTGSGVGDLEASLGIDVGSTLIEQYQSEAFQNVVETEAADSRTLTLRLLGDHTLGERGELRASATYADVHHDEVITDSIATANSYRQRLWSAGVETEWELGSAGTSSLTVGFAVDGSDTPESGDKPAIASRTDFGARIGASSLVVDGVLLHGGVSRRSRFPSLRELYSGALGRFEPNPGLQPETLVGIEGGVTATRSGSEIQLVGFHQRLSDGIVRTTVVGADMVRRFQRVNQDQVLSTGIELLGVAAFGSTTASGDLTFQSVTGRDATGGDVELEYEPSLVGRLGVDWPVLAGARAAADFRFVGGQSCENPESGGLQPLSSSRTVDFSLRRIFERLGGGWGRVDARASVRNVTDALVYDQCGLPQPGRLFQIQFRIS